MAGGIQQADIYRLESFMQSYTTRFKRQNPVPTLVNVHPMIHRISNPIVRYIQVTSRNREERCRSTAHGHRVQSVKSAWLTFEHRQCCFRSRHIPVCNDASALGPRIDASAERNSKGRGILCSCDTRALVITSVWISKKRAVLVEDEKRHGAL